MISIVLADDHHLVRQAFRALLSTDPSFQVTGEASDGRAAIDLVERLRPDILILDLSMPGLDGLEVVRITTKRFPATRALIVTMHSGEDYALRALRSGAQGYVLKDASADVLIEAVHAVASGERYVSSSLLEHLEHALAMHARLSEIGESGAPPDVYDTLTTREREIFRLIADGSTNNEIADRLCISVRTVEVHRANLMRKLNLRSHGQLLAYAMERSLTEEGR